MREQPNDPTDGTNTVDDWEERLFLHIGWTDRSETRGTTTDCQTKTTNTVDYEGLVLQTLQNIIEGMLQSDQQSQPASTLATFPSSIEPLENDDSPSNEVLLELSSMPWIDVLTAPFQDGFWLDGTTNMAQHDGVWKDLTMAAAEWWVRPCWYWTTQEALFASAVSLAETLHDRLIYPTHRMTTKKTNVQPTVPTNGSRSICLDHLQFTVTVSDDATLARVPHLCRETNLCPSSAHVFALCTSWDTRLIRKVIGSITNTQDHRYTDGFLAFFRNRYGLTHSSLPVTPATSDHKPDSVVPSSSISSTPTDTSPPMASILANGNANHSDDDSTISMVDSGNVGSNENDDNTAMTMIQDEPINSQDSLESIEKVLQSCSTPTLPEEDESIRTAANKEVRLVSPTERRGMVPVPVAESSIEETQQDPTVPTQAFSPQIDSQGIDLSVLSQLPREFRSEARLAVALGGTGMDRCPSDRIEKSTGITNWVASNKDSKSNLSTRCVSMYADDIDPTVLAELPEDVRASLDAMILPRKAKRRKHEPAGRIDTFFGRS